jgi:Cysteine-rich CPXCG
MQSYFATRWPEQQWHKLKPEVLWSQYFSVQDAANGTFVDVPAGMQQSYVEDCQVCCRPNVLHIRGPFIQ